MAFSIEFRCDWRHAWEPEGFGGDACWSHHNAGPAEIADNTARGVTKARDFLVQSFRTRGVRRIGENWACPVCAKKIKAGTLPRDPDAEEDRAG